MNKVGLIQRLPFSFPGIDGDIQRLGELLGRLFSAAGVSFPSRISILNLACGRADETGVLIDTVKPAETTFYLGMDLRADAIDEAARRWDLLHGEIEFREGNAAMVGRMKGLPKFDLIFIRHQNYWHEPMVWEGILDEALSALEPDGYLMCTSYFDLEHELFLASMRERGVRQLANMRHPESRDLADAEGKSVDRWAAVFSRGEAGKPVT